MFHTACSKSTRHIFTLIFCFLNWSTSRSFISLEHSNTCQMFDIKFADSLSFISCGYVVALEERLHEKAQCSHHTHQDEDPQEQTVYHHGNVFPVFDDLKPEERGSRWRGSVQTGPCCIALAMIFWAAWWFRLTTRLGGLGLMWPTVWT